MCSHYEATTDPERYLRHFSVALPAGAELHDLWPGYGGSFIRRPRSEDHAGDPPDREAMVGVFGLIPHWSKDSTISRHTHNARSETVAEKPSYRDAWRLGRRCIIPADAFYEPDWRSGRAVATRIARADGKPMGLAGIWTGWRAPDGSIVRSYSMLTINADAHVLMNQFHKPQDEKRIVVILPEERYHDWLHAPMEHAHEFLQPYPSDWMVASAAQLSATKLI